jgi:hypothetical protein
MADAGDDGGGEWSEDDPGEPSCRERASPKAPLDGVPTESLWLSVGP